MLPGLLFLRNRQVAVKSLSYHDHNHHQPRRDFWKNRSTLEPTRRYGTGKKWRLQRLKLQPLPFIYCSAVNNSIFDTWCLDIHKCHKKARQFFCLFFVCLFVWLFFLCFFFFFRFVLFRFKSQVNVWLHIWSHVALSLKDNWEGEGGGIERAEKADIRKAELPTVRQACKAMFWPTPCLEGKTSDSSGSTADGILTYLISVRCGN